MSLKIAFVPCFEITLWTLICYTSMNAFYVFYQIALSCCFVITFRTLMCFAPMNRSHVSLKVAIHCRVIITFWPEWTWKCFTFMNGVNVLLKVFFLGCFVITIKQTIKISWHGFKHTMNELTIVDLWLHEKFLTPKKKIFFVCLFIEALAYLLLTWRDMRAWEKYEQCTE